MPPSLSNFGSCLSVVTARQLSPLLSPQGNFQSQSLFFDFLWRHVRRSFPHFGHTDFSPCNSFLSARPPYLCRLNTCASPFLSARLTLLFAPAALPYAVLSAPAFHSGKAVCGQKRGDVPGRLRSCHVWDISRKILHYYYSCLSFGSQWKRYGKMLISQKQSIFSMRFLL